VLTQYKFDTYYDKHLTAEFMFIPCADISSRQLCGGDKHSAPTSCSNTDVSYNPNTCKVLVSQQNHLEDLGTDREDVTKTDLKEIKWEHGLDSSSCG